MCRLLGLAILWAAFDPNASQFLDPVSADRIRTNFQSVHAAVVANGMDASHRGEQARQNRDEKLKLGKTEMTWQLPF